MRLVVRPAANPAARPPAAGRLARGSVLRTVHQFALVGVSFAMMPFMVHTLGDHYFGMWALVGTFVSFTGFLDFGLSQAVTRFLAAGLGSGDEEQCNRVFNTALAWYVAVGALVVEFTLRLKHGGAMGAADFPPAFLAIGALSAAAALIFVRLAPDAGAELSGRKAARPVAASTNKSSQDRQHVPGRDA